MKLIFSLASLISITSCYAQWTRVSQLPASDIFSFYSKSDSLYAGGKSVVYFSRDRGDHWDSTNAIPSFTEVTDIIIYKNELYASSFSRGVMKSSNGGASWLDINSGLLPFVSGFCEFNGELFAATLGGAVFKLDPLRLDRWLPFSDGLSNQSLNITAVAATSNTMIAGTLANGMYGRISIHSTTWQEDFLLGQINPTEAVRAIVTAHDSLFLSGSSGTLYMSINNGIEWKKIGIRLATTFASIANAKEALLIAQNTFDGINNSTFFHYIKKNALADPVVNFSFVPVHFTYKIDIAGGKLWDASTNGLFYMPLSVLPGIGSEDGGVSEIPLPVKFISFNAALHSNKTVALSWKTSGEVDVDHFEIERSTDQHTWAVLSTMLPIFSGDYSFSDASPDKNINYYRIKEIGKSGAFFFSAIRSITTKAELKFIAWPNPASDHLYVQMPFARGAFKIINEWGAVLSQGKIQSTSTDISVRTLIPGNYFLQITNGEERGSIKFIKR